MESGCPFLFSLFFHPVGILSVFVRGAKFFDVTLVSDSPIIQYFWRIRHTYLYFEESDLHKKGFKLLVAKDILKEHLQNNEILIVNQGQFYNFVHYFGSFDL